MASQPWLVLFVLQLVPVTCVLAATYLAYWTRSLLLWFPFFLAGVVAYGLGVAIFLKAEKLTLFEGILAR